MTVGRFAKTVEVAHRYHWFKNTVWQAAHLWLRES